MRVGILYKTKRQHSTAVNVSAALGEFNRAIHTQGHKPVAVLFPPAQFNPELKEIAGLRAKPSRHIRINHIRVVSAHLSPPDELAADRAEFAQQVEEAVLSPPS